MLIELFNSCLEEDLGCVSNNAERNDELSCSQLLPYCLPRDSHEIDLGYHIHLTDLNFHATNDPVFALKSSSVS